MNRFTRPLIKVGAITALAVGSYALPALALAAAPSNAVTITSAELQAKADHHAMMAAYYRARMRVDEKHAIQWFTLANHCDQKADRYHHLAVLQSGTEPTILR
jgi:hypothetical protein